MHGTPVAVSAFPAPIASVGLTLSAGHAIQLRLTHMIQELDSHLNVSRLPSNNDQPFAFVGRWGRCSTDSHTNSPRFHDANLTGRHLPDFVDFRSTFADDTSHEVVWDIDLLSL